MIHKQEIMSVAKKYSLPPNSIEKDYVLSWLLAGIYNSNTLQEKWIFKGGTCIKKCYIQEYRFSEDLDFTLLDESQLDEKFLLSAFSELSDWVYQKSGLEFPSDLMKFVKYNNPQGGISVEGRISYKGPMQRKHTTPTVKLDLTSDELLIDKNHKKPLLHHYSDKQFCQASISTYCIEEIFAEKLRALYQRTRPRDLFDIIRLFNHDSLVIDKARAKNMLAKKCQYKSIEIPSMGLINLTNKRQQLYDDWHYMLAHQISDLEPADIFWEKLPAMFLWLDEV